GSPPDGVGGSEAGRPAREGPAKAGRPPRHVMEGAEPDGEVRDGAFRRGGTDRQVRFPEVARAAHLGHNLPDGVEPGLQESVFYDPPNFAFSNGAHVAEVEVDPETGEIRLVGYWVVDDVGVVVNPMIVEGQVHGGLAQGLGQAWLEGCAYDAETAQLLSASFMDYALPRADALPSFATEVDESQPCTHNPLG